MKNKASLLQSFLNALKGLATVFKDERNAKIHALASILVIIASWYYSISAIEWILVVCAIGMVIITEVINTAIENTMDFISTEHHPHIGKIKDISAGAVFVSALIAVVIGAIIFIPKIIV